MEYKTQYEYYQDKKFLSTHADFKSAADLLKHEQSRRRVFTDRLYLPPSIFRDSELIEFGPDCGENSLVFAYWKANCRLIEPNPATHQIIKGYFNRFGLTDKLRGIDALDIKGFAKHTGDSRKKKYDFVDAEGFIYTVKPNVMWMNLFSEITNPGGFVLIDYYDKFGAYIELFQKVLHSRVKGISGQSSEEVARSVFMKKWNSISHRRSLEVWTKDVLESPFVRLNYFLEAEKLCEEMYNSEFNLYSSWPNYRDNLRVEWLKKPVNWDDNLRHTEDTISRSRIGYIFGRKHYLTRIDLRLTKKLYDLIWTTDGLIDLFDEKKARKCIATLEEVKEIVRFPYVLSDKNEETGSRNMAKSLQEIMKLLIEGKVDRIVRFCNRDERFIRNWGMPLHFAIFQKRE